MWFTRYGRKLEELEKRLAEMEDAYSRVVELEADWQDWLHKIRNVLARLNQRARAEEAVAPPDPPINPAAARLLGWGIDQRRE